MPRRALVLFAFAALTLITPVSIRAWELDGLALKRVPITATWQTVEAGTSADLDGDSEQEMLSLTHGRAAIQTDRQIRWQSPEAWQVEQAQIADLNRDGFPEAVLLVWRPFKPWPVDVWLPNGGRIENFHDSEGQSCHMILIGWKQGAFRELWAGSALAEPVKQFMAVELAGDGQQYLVTLEGEYDDPPPAPARTLKVWEWNGFGFTVVNELAKSFNLMVPARRQDGQVLILTD